MGYDDRYRTVPRGRVIEMLLLGGWAYERETPQAMTVTCAALDTWVGMGLPNRRGADGEALFDPVEVLNFFKLAGLEGRDGFWAERYLPTGRRMVEELAPGHGASFDVEVRRTFDLSGAAPGKTMRLRMPLPLAGAHGDLQVEPFIEGGEASLAVSDGRLEARLPSTGGRVTLGAKLRFSTAPQALAGAGGRMEDTAYLKPREGLIAVTDRVNDLSRALAGPGAPVDTAVRAFWAYVMEALKCGAIHYDQISPEAPCDWILDTGWCDCQLGASLFIALCRAWGAPARLVGGHLLYRKAPTNHYWAEVWFEDRGWVPFDFYGWDLSFGGRDLAWRDRFYGHIDGRMITQRMPFEFTGALGVPMPPAWTMLQVADGEGVAISLISTDGALIYSDVVTIGATA